MNYKPSVSIVTPVFNARETFRETYDSVVFQKYRDFEWIIIDDSSTDGSFEYIMDLSKLDRRVRVFRNRGEKGAGGARNFGLEHISGSILTFIDSDDMWDPLFLSVMVPIVSAGIPIAFSGYRRLSGKEVISEFHPVKVVKDGDLFRGSDISCLSTVYNLRIIGVPPKFGEVVTRNDLVFNIRALRNCKFAVPVPLILATYRVGQNSLSRNKVRAAVYQFRVSRMFGRTFLVSVIDVIFWGLYGMRKYLMKV